MSTWEAIAAGTREFDRSYSAYQEQAAREQALNKEREEIRARGIEDEAKRDQLEGRLPGANGEQPDRADRNGSWLDRALNGFTSIFTGQHQPQAEERTPGIAPPDARTPPPAPAAPVQAAIPQAVPQAAPQAAPARPATALDPAREQQFQQWYAQHARTQRLNPNPDDPAHHYDYRAAFNAGAGPGPDGHWPSAYKADDHPNRFINGVDTRTGQPQAAIPPRPAPTTAPAPAPAPQSAAAVTGTSGQPGAPPAPPGYNRDAYRDVATGQGMIPPDTLENGVRMASGNRNGPIRDRDVFRYIDVVEDRLIRAGLGHRVDEMRGRTLQQFQSAAARTLIQASVAADQGNMQEAARLAMRAYNFVPDGLSAQVSQGPNGTTVVTTVDQHGRVQGQPFELTADKLRDMAIASTDPMNFAKLLVSRRERDQVDRQMTETERKNRAQEEIERAKIAAAGARAGAGGQTGASLEDQARAATAVNNVFDDVIAANPSTRSGTTVNRQAAKATAQELLQSGQVQTPYEAATFAVAQHVGSGVQYGYGRTPQGQPMVYGRLVTPPATPGGPPQMGRPIPLTGMSASIAQRSLNAAGVQPPAPVTQQRQAVPVRRNQNTGTVAQVE